MAPLESRSRSVVMPGLAIATIALVSAYIFGDARSMFHSDTALRSVLAKVALEEGSLVPQGWMFANGDLMISGPYPLSFVIDALFGTSFLGNAAASWIAFAALLASLFFALRRAIPESSAYVFLGVALGASMLSAANLEFVATQGAYSLAAAAQIALATLFLAPGGRRPLRLASVGAISFLLAVSNPKRAWVLSFAPFIAALVALVLTDGRYRRSFRELIPEFIALVGSALLGSLAYYLVILPGVLNYDAAANVKLASPAYFLQVLGNLPSDWYAYFMVGGSWEAISIWLRIVQLVVWALATAIWIAPAYLILSRTTSAAQRLYAWQTYAFLGAGLAPLCLLEGLYTGAMEIRYASTGIFFGIISVCSALSVAASRGTTGRASRPSFIALVLGACAVVVAAHWQWATQPTNPDSHGVSMEQRERLIATLREEKVGTAMATYWNSHVVSVLSNGGVFSNPVGYSTRLFPYPHHAPETPLHGTAGSREALVLKKEELEAYGPALVRAQLGEPVEVIDSDPFVVWIYDGHAVDEVYAADYRINQPVSPSSVALTLSHDHIAPCGNDTCKVELVVTNSGQATLATAGTAPMRIGLRGLGADGAVVIQDLGRIEFMKPLKSGQKARLSTSLPGIPGQVESISACLLQEGVQWLCERTSVDVPAPIDSPIDPKLASVSISGGELHTCTTDAGCMQSFEIYNSGDTSINSGGLNPLVIGYRLRQPPQDANTITEGRIDVGGTPIAAGETRKVEIRLPKSSAEAEYETCLLQENVRWLCGRTTTSP